MKIPPIIHALGLDALLERGAVTMDRKATDPDNPNRTITQLNRYDPVRALWKKGTLTTEHWLAAERFRDDHGMAEGAREQAAGGGTPCWMRSYADKQLDAVTRRRLAMEAVGLRLSAVFVGAVLEQEAMSAIDKRLKTRNGSATELLVEAMGRLAKHYARA